jgi:saccharopine dehydrogenase (NAD+, L-lysine-forming)
MRSIPFPGGEREASAIAWGDISTAWQSTGVPDITVYASMRGLSEAQLEKVSSKRRFFRIQWIQQFMKWIVGRSVKGPSKVERKEALTSLWGEAVNERGDCATGGLITPDGYDLTADAALLSVEGILEGSVEPGATTPSKAFGASFVDKLDNVECIPVTVQPVS